MVQQLLADSILLLHLTFILFVIFGGFLIIRKPAVIWLHVPAMMWGLAMTVLGWGCPLTHLEKWLRKAAGQNGYEGGFIEHYLAPLIYPGGMPHEAEPLSGVFVLLCNIAIYAFVFSRIRQRQTAEKRIERAE
ncbi:MAG: DUF2784 domain-containing protein [Chlorobiales bacterium]|nr:DUF2784 domain-containing protein [Chlorobiales bacterium]